jgi:hypothetical protein
MKYNINVIKSVWRQWRKPSRATLAAIGSQNLRNTPATQALDSAVWQQVARLEAGGRDLLTMAKATKPIHQVNRTMKKTAIAVAAALVALGSSVEAKVGETPTELVARYGQMPNPFGLMMGIGQWNVKTGGQVTALFSGGMAEMMIYTGKEISAEKANELMTRNLPAGQEWVESADVKQWFYANVPGAAAPNQQTNAVVKQTKDGRLWAVISQGEGVYIGTKQGWDLFRRIGEMNKAQATPAPQPEATTPTSLEAQCRNIAKQNWPDDFTMQKYVYNQQLAAARYMQSSNVTDAEVKAKAISQWPNDFTMQRYVYNQQVKAKSYMKSLEN